jgi:hypothetical protein
MQTRGVGCTKCLSLLSALSLLLSLLSPAVFFAKLSVTRPACCSSNGPKTPNLRLCDKLIDNGICVNSRELRNSMTHHHRPLMLRHAPAARHAQSKTRNTTPYRFCDFLWILGSRSSRCGSAFLNVVCDEKLSHHFQHVRFVRAALLLALYRDRHRTTSSFPSQRFREQSHPARSLPCCRLGAADALNCPSNQMTI